MFPRSSALPTDFYFVRFFRNCSGEIVITMASFGFFILRGAKDHSWENLARSALTGAAGTPACVNRL